MTSPPPCAATLGLDEAKTLKALGALEGSAGNNTTFESFYFISLVRLGLPLPWGKEFLGLFQGTLHHSSQDELNISTDWE